MTTTLNAATIAALIARAQAANHPDAWRDVALTLAESWPAPKRAPKARKGTHEYARALVTFADGHRELVGTTLRMADGSLDLAYCERIAIHYRKAVLWAPLPTSAYRWVRVGGRSRLIPPECLLAPVAKVEPVSKAEADRIRPTLPRTPWVPDKYAERRRQLVAERAHNRPPGGAAIFNLQQGR